MTQHIIVKNETWKKLQSMKNLPGMTFDDVVNKLIEHKHKHKHENENENEHETRTFNTK